MINTISVIVDKKEGSDHSNVCEKRGSDFETAVSAAGYGKFQYLLFLTIFPVAWLSTLDTSNMSMILPKAECDLKLTLFQKGVLNAMAYAGMMGSAFFWGFISDVLGRRKVVVYGCLADSLCNILSGLSQNFETLVVFKFISGAIISGPFASLMSYCTEFHTSRARPRVTLLVGLCGSFGGLVNAGLALLVIPQSWSLSFLDGTLVYNSWRIFLSLCGVPALLGVICLFFFPESPKFLMSQGRNDEALEVFKTMFTMNTGQPRDKYPILFLEEEMEQRKVKVALKTSSRRSSFSESSKDESVLFSLRKGIKQMKPLFLRPHVSRLILVLVIQTGVMLALNTIRLWQPQLFAILSQSKQTEGSTTFCEVLDISLNLGANKSTNLGDEERYLQCINTPITSTVYSNTLIVSTTTMLSMITAGIFVNLLGNKVLMMICTIIGAISVAALNWSSTTTITLLLTCLIVAAGSTANVVAIAISISLFPTRLRTMSVSLLMMFGRIGSLAGNILFPILLQYGCIASLVCLTSFFLVCLVLILFIPKPSGDMK